jgi:chromate transporter
MESGSAAAGSLSATATAAAPRAPTRAEALRYWLRLGCISFGGPAGQIAIMHRELVDERRWISEGRFLHALNYCMVLPGPEAQQLATYIGWLLHRTWGGIVAGGLFVLPSLAVLIALSWLYVTFGDVPLVAAALYGVKPAVVAIVLHAAWRIGTRALRHWLLWAIAALAFVAIYAFDVPFPLIVLGAGVLGALGARVHPAAFARTTHANAKGGRHAPALIDDDTPTPPHARFTSRRLALVVVAGVLLWSAAIGALMLAEHGERTLTQMAGFFTRAALLTFGGAYAVLPYVFQAAVETYGWITPAQMIDGLALGETTPGPLIMVVAFVGYVGASAKALFGTDARFAAGVAGACVATFFTFLPSFLFILAGGPLVERTHGQARFVAPLTGITAAVVGVIVNLAVFFALHVFQPHAGGWQGVDVTAVAIALLAGLALFRLRIGVIPVILAAAGAGVVLQLVRPLLPP